MTMSRKKISVEDYVKFYGSYNKHKLPINFLNQIISMHGFKKIIKGPKKLLTEAIETLEVMNLTRSTLDSAISPTALLKFEELQDDLKGLKWEECNVTSVETLNPVSESFPASHQADATNLATNSDDCHHSGLAIDWDEAESLTQRRNNDIDRVSSSIR